MPDCSDALLGLHVKRKPQEWWHCPSTLLNSTLHNFSQEGQQDPTGRGSEFPGPNQKQCVPLLSPITKNSKLLLPMPARAQATATSNFLVIGDNKGPRTKSSFSKIWPPLREVRLWPFCKIPLGKRYCLAIEISRNRRSLWILKTVVESGSKSRILSGGKVKISSTGLHFGKIQKCKAWPKIHKHPP